jgi:hypothetical protein
VSLRPLGLERSRIDGGFWGIRRRTNHLLTIPHGAEQLQEAGNLTNFALAAGAPGSYRGNEDDNGAAIPFLDSDVYKWLEAVGWELVQTPDAALLAIAGRMIGQIESAQRADGYLDTYFQVARPGMEFTDLQWGHELYMAGHLVQAAIAWSRGLGDERLLRVAERVVQRIDRELGPGRRELICGHPEFEMALVELYRLTGERHYLDFAGTLVERRGHGLLGECKYGAGYWQDHEPVRTAAEPAGHAVRQLYLECGAVDLALETGDRELLEAVIGRWESMVASRTYLTGGLGSRHRDEAFGDRYELPADRAYAETCAAIASVMLSWRLLLATGQTRFADLIERTAFNGVLPALSFDGTHFFYSNPLMRRSSVVEVLEGPATTRRAKWFPVACCPPNLMRFLATFPDLATTSNRGGVQLHQYVSGSFDAPVGSGVVQIVTKTEYPWDGTVEIAIGREIPEEWTLSMRVPGWCSSASARLVGSDETVAGGPGSLEIKRTWLKGDRVILRLEMPPRVTVPDPRIDAIRGHRALERGPLVYAIEDADLASGESVESLEIVTPANLESSVRSVPGIGKLTVVSFDAMVRIDESPAEWPYQSDGIEVASRPARRRRLRAIPFFAWANRPGLGMRVWIPAATQGANR